MSVNKDRYEFTYWPGDEEGYADYVCLTYEAPEGIHAAAFHRMCKKFGLALGYAPETIERYFGPDSDDDLFMRLGYDD